MRSFLRYLIELRPMLQAGQTIRSESTYFVQIFVKYSQTKPIHPWKRLYSIASNAQFTCKRANWSRARRCFGSSWGSVAGLLANKFFFEVFSYGACSHWLQSYAPFVASTDYVHQNNKAPVNCTYLPFSVRTHSPRAISRFLIGNDSMNSGLFFEVYQTNADRQKMATPKCLTKAFICSLI